MFGGFDGATSVVGVILTLTGHSGQVIPAAVGLAAAGGVGMCAGQWLSDDDDAGPVQAVVIGIATAIGTLLPATPYMMATGTAAMLASAAILVLIGAVITAVRTRTSSRTAVRAAAETYGVLVAVCAAVALCAVATGAGG